MMVVVLLFCVVVGVVMINVVDFLVIVIEMDFGVSVFFIFYVCVLIVFVVLLVICDFL